MTCHRVEERGRRSRIDDAAWDRVDWRIWKMALEEVSSRQTGRDVVDDLRLKHAHCGIRAHCDDGSHVAPSIAVALACLMDAVGLSTCIEPKVFRHGSA